MLFAAFYALLRLTGLATRAAVAHGPSVVQALLAASTDLHVYWLGQRVGGEALGKWALAFQLTNWFTWYASVRTFSSSLEAALLVPAVYHWLSVVENATTTTARKDKKPLSAAAVSCEERVALVLGALAIAVRPTAVFAWVPLGLWRLLKTRPADVPVYLLREVVPCTGLVFGASVLLDSYCYRLLSPSRQEWAWVVTPLNFLRINLFKGVAAHYGSHPFHWYFTLGALTVLTTQLPFIVQALRRALALRAASSAFFLLALVLLAYPLGLSLSPHKEFRFLLPLLPLASVLGAHVAVHETLPYLSSFPLLSPRKTKKARASGRPSLLLLLALLVTQAPVAVYFSRVHQRGPIDVMAYLAHRLANMPPGTNTHVHIDFLMPCHATPWTTHLHVPAFFASSSSSSSTLTLKHLDCSPLVHEQLQQLTETESFLADPLGFATQLYGEWGWSSSSRWLGMGTGAPLPDFIVAFGSAAKEMETFLVSRKGYDVEATLFHSAFKGDVDSPRHEDSIVIFARRPAITWLV